LIAEDEPPILRDIRAVLEGIPGVEVVAEARDGGAALAMLEDSRPDLILTDIRMPVVDGLGLIDRAKQHVPGIQAVVITGYDEFEYARKACHLGVRQYLLKPVDEAEVRRVMRQVREAARTTKRNALNRFLDGEGPRESVGLHSTDYQVFLVILGFHDPSARWGDSDQSAGRNVLAQLCSRIEAHLEADLELDDVVFALGSPRSNCIRVIVGRPAPDETELVSARLRTIVDQEATTFYTIVRVPDIRDLVSLREQAHRGETNLSRLVTPYHSSVIDDATVESRVSADVPQEAYLSSLCANGQTQLIAKTMEDTIRGACDRGCSQYEVEKLIRRFVTVATAAMVFTDDPDVPALEHAMLTSFRSAANVEDAAQSVTAPLSRIFRHRARSVGARDLVRNVESYLHAHYGDPVDNQLLGRLFGLVPHYLSAVYKRHKNRSPTEHLSEIRIERAKEALLDAPGLPIRDVACSVGFTDQSYFTKVFKRHVGITPGAYRHNNGKATDAT
jgi:two-component system response regulator YesN